MSEDFSYEDAEMELANLRANKHALELEVEKWRIKVQYLAKAYWVTFTELKKEGFTNKEALALIIERGYGLSGE